MYKSTNNFYNLGNGINSKKSNWSYNNENANRINFPQKSVKCKANPDHSLEKQYIENGPHKCKIICVDCGGMFVQWAKDDRKMSSSKKPSTHKGEDYWKNKTEQFVKDHNDDPKGVIPNLLDDVLGIK